MICIPYHTIPYHTIPYHTIPYHVTHTTPSSPLSHTTVSVTRVSYWSVSGSILWRGINRPQHLATSRGLPWSILIIIFLVIVNYFWRNLYTKIATSKYHTLGCCLTPKSTPSSAMQWRLGCEEVVMDVTSLSGLYCHRIIPHIVWYGVIWCGMVWCGTVEEGLIL